MIRGIFLSLLLFVLGSAFLIITIPWLWNWIVTIWNSPLPAGEATRVYLLETLEILAMPFLLCIFCIIGLDAVINKDKYATSEYSLLPAKIETEKSLNSPPTPQETPSQKSNGGFDFTIKEIVNDRGGVKKHAPGSQAAIDAWNNSEEKLALEKRKLEIEKQIAKHEGKENGLDT